MLLAIADHEGDGGAWPSMDTLARRGRVTKDAARKIVRRLEDRGEITTEINGGGGLRTAAHMRTNRYEVNVKCPEWCDRTARHRDVRETPADPPAVGTAPVPSNGGPPFGGTAEPPINHPKATNDVSRSEVMGTPEQDSFSNQGQANYSDWSPGKQIAEAARRAAEAETQHKPVKRPDYSKPTTANRVPPAPSIPRFDPSTQPVKPEAVSLEQQQLNTAAEEYVCPAGFGTGKNRMHWCPSTGDGCCRCGTTSAQIVGGPTLEEFPA